MRRTFALVFCVLLAACGKERVMPVTAPWQGVICFGDCTVGVEVETRAYAENKAADILADGFGCACVTSQGVTVFNERCAWDAGRGVYLPVGSPYYYPGTGTVDFYAAYPASSQVTLLPGTASLAWAEDPDGDLLTAVRTDVQKGTSAVRLTFGHALSLVRFRAVGTDPTVTYRVRSVGVECPSSGTYSYSSSGWTPTGGPVTVGSFSGDLALSGTTDIPGAVTVIPSTPVVKVSWDCLSEGSLIASYSESRALPEALLPGQECEVTLRLPNRDAVGIVLDITATAWDTTSQDVSFGD